MNAHRLNPGRLMDDETAGVAIVVTLVAFGFCFGWALRGAFL